MELSGLGALSIKNYFYNRIWHYLLKFFYLKNFIISRTAILQVQTSFYLRITGIFLLILVLNFMINRFLIFVIFKIYDYYEITKEVFTMKNNTCTCIGRSSRCCRSSCKNAVEKKKSINLKNILQFLIFCTIKPQYLMLFISIFPKVL